MNKINLFCLPFAGGSRYSYRGYVKAAPSNLHVIPVELPGRGARFKERLMTDIHHMVDDVFLSMADKLEVPYAIYGHSMGTLLTYLLTKKIIKHKIPKPKRLILSGCGGPSVLRHEVQRHALPKDEFVESLRVLGGSPDEILNDESLLGFFEPILRADFKAIETYRHKESPGFDIPMTVMIGKEEKVSYEDAQSWQKETTGDVEVLQFPGRHFFIFDYEKEIMSLINNRLTLKPMLNEK